MDDKKYIDLIKEGSLLEAIKAYKEDKGCSLSEAKEHIESLANKLPKSEKTGGKGCAITLLVIISSIVGLTALVM